MARILIVDDSAVARKILAALITSLGHVVAGEAVDGSQAIEEYARIKPDVVTMDLAMQGADGPHAISRLVDIYPDAQIIVISAQQDAKLIKHALTLGAKHFIAKPVSPEKFATKLNEVLNSKINLQKLARVLIVDDSAVARTSLREILTSLGHTVVGEAANGAQAFVEFVNLKPDVVTMDLTMQGMGGAEATSKIIATQPEAKIIIISALETRRGIIDALERGARHFIIKPIHKEKVAAVLKNVLEQNFDHHKHMEFVRRLKEAENCKGTEIINTNKHLPPYEINIQADNLVHVSIYQGLSNISCQTLLTEISEHILVKPRVLLDFGSTARLDEALLIKLNELIMAIENNNGLVRAVSNNKNFVNVVSETEYPDGANLLTRVLRYYENC